MRVLITGVAGFVGRHLAAELAANGHEVFGFDIGTPPPDLPLRACSVGNIRDPAAIHQAIEQSTPDACVHLAGYAFVPVGHSVPERMLDVNLMGTIHVLEAFRSVRPATRILAVSTAHVYGSRPRASVIVETDPLDPDSFYAVAKAGSDVAARLYATEYAMPVIVARPYNHIGPGQSPQFAVASFARQVKAIAAGAEPLMRVGNLDSERDFTDVRDMARAYRLLLERGRPAEAYNIASGRAVRVGHILQRMCELAGIVPRIERDPARYRADTLAPQLDSSKLRTDTGWEPRLPLDQTLRDILAAS